jgi:hypothetical protein
MGGMHTENAEMGSKIAEIQKKKKYPMDFFHIS